MRQYNASWKSRKAERWGQKLESGRWRAGKKVKKCSQQLEYEQIQKIRTPCQGIMSALQLRFNVIFRHGWKMRSGSCNISSQKISYYVEAVMRKSLPTTLHCQLTLCLSWRLGSLSNLRKGILPYPLKGGESVVICICQHAFLFEDFWVVFTTSEAKERAVVALEQNNVSLSRENQTSSGISSGWKQLGKDITFETWNYVIVLFRS